MNMSRNLITFVSLFMILRSEVFSLNIFLSNNGPAVQGSNITFIATVPDYNGGELKYTFWDDAEPQHRKGFVVTSNTCNWTLSYPRGLYESKDYTMTVKLEQKIFNLIWYYANLTTTTFKITSTLNGNIVLKQNNSSRPNNYVAVNQLVHHVVKLPENEIDFLNKNTSIVITYWFIDCIYIDQSTDYSFNFTYKDLMGSHQIDALVTADTEPLPPITTTTISTTTTTTTTSTTTTTTPKPNTVSTLSTQAPNMNVSTLSIPIINRTKREVINNKLQNPICADYKIIHMDDSNIYGYYQQLIEVREPISSVNITGMNWLQHGDLMNLQVVYKGSPPFNYCALYKVGEYNVTGNETCKSTIHTVTYNFTLVHYFSDIKKHTVVVIIENQVGKTFSHATITIYEVTTHAQLSVIVVPLVFCLVAVILVVFGVAYYIQSRSRYTIEVADFDFGQQANFDYKTFLERLRESFSSTFRFGHPQDDEDPLTGTTI